MRENSIISNIQARFLQSKESFLLIKCTDHKRKLYYKYTPYMKCLASDIVLYYRQCTPNISKGCTLVVEGDVRIGARHLLSILQIPSTEMRLEKDSKIFEHPNKIWKTNWTL